MSGNTLNTCFSWWRWVKVEFRADEHFGRSRVIFCAPVVGFIVRFQISRLYRALGRRGLDWKRLGSWSLSLTSSFYGGFTPPCLVHNRPFVTEERLPRFTVSVWGLLPPRLMINSIPACASNIFSWSLWHSLRAPRSRFPSLKSPKKTAVRVRASFILTT